MNNIQKKKIDPVAAYLANAKSIAISAPAESVVIENNVAFLCDTSGSMADIDDGKHRRIDLLKQALMEIWEGGHAAKIYSFGGFQEVVPAATPFSIPEPRGGTPLAEAIATASKASHIIVISDGIANNPATAIQQARATQARIDVIFVGNAHDQQAIDLMRALTQKGGKLHQQRLSGANAAELLGTTIRKLLS